jgi:hypothetical protein
MTTTPVRAPYPETDSATLRLELGACRLVLSAGAEDAWLEGTYDDPTDELGIRFVESDGVLTLSQQRSVSGVLNLFRGTPTATLRLGAGRSYALEVLTGASDVELHLAGLPLTDLSVRSGAGKVEVAVDAESPVQARTLSFRVGAGALETYGLGNLNAARLEVDAGAAGVELDLRGSQTQPLTGRITAGMSGLQVVVPAGRPARVTVDTTLGGLDLGDGFVTSGGEIRTMVEGDPIITLSATVALGGLQLSAK